ncbi:MAG: FISUMP domain-containing protein [Ignavibacteriota bacterium]
MKKIILLITVVFITNNILSQTMVVKKADGSYMEVSITDSVELCFYLPCPGTPTVFYEGKTYNTVQIDSQCWLKENLDVGTRMDGIGDQTNNSLIEKYCYNDDPNNCTTYGGLYQWNEAMQYVTNEGAKGICPTGWHLPTLAEFTTLSTTVGMDGNVLKAVGQGSGDGAGTNISGFSALLAGGRGYDGYFTNLGYYAYFWSSTEYGATDANGLDLIGSGSDVFLYDGSKEFGFSIRCLKD